MGYCRVWLYATAATGIYTTGTYTYRFGWPRGHRTLTYTVYYACVAYMRQFRTFVGSEIDVNHTERIPAGQYPTLHIAKLNRFQKQV